MGTYQFLLIQVMDFSPSQIGVDVEDFSIGLDVFNAELDKPESVMPDGKRNNYTSIYDYVLRENGEFPDTARGLTAKLIDAYVVFLADPSSGNNTVYLMSSSCTRCKSFLQDPLGIKTSQKVITKVCTIVPTEELANFNFECNIINILTFAPTTRAEVIGLGAKSHRIQIWFRDVTEGVLLRKRQWKFIIKKLKEMECGTVRPFDSKAFLKKQISANEKKINAIENEKKQHRTEAEAAAKIKKQTKNKARRRRRKARAKRKRHNRPEAQPSALKKREIAAQPEWTKRIALDQVLKERGTKTIEVYCISEQFAATQMYSC